MFVGYIKISYKNTSKTKNSSCS